MALSAIADLTSSDCTIMILYGCRLNDEGAVCVVSNIFLIILSSIGREAKLYSDFLELHNNSNEEGVVALTEHLRVLLPSKCKCI